MKLPLSISPVAGHRIHGTDGELVCAAQGRDAHEHAELIVRAVNSHDELVQALKDCLHVMHSTNVPSSARAALAKATGQRDAS